MSKKRNIKFFRNFILTILAVYITTFAFIELFPFFFNSVNNTRWIVAKNILDKKYDLSDSSITTLFIGDSRLNAGIDFTKIEDSWSFGMGGSTPIENYYILKKYISTYNKPETVYMSISPRFLSETFAFWDLAVRNNFFTKDEFYEIAENSKQLNDTIFRCTKIKFWLYKLNFPTLYKEDIRRNLVVFGKEKNLKLISYIFYNRGRRPHPDLKESCSLLNYETKMKTFSPAPIFDLYFEKIIELCENENIGFVFMPMPMNESSFEKLNADFITDFLNYMIEKQKKYPDFIISNELIFLPDSLFGDESHLNYKGTEFFTEEFLNISF